MGMSKYRYSHVPEQWTLLSLAVSNKSLLLLLVRLHDQSSSSDEVGGLLQVLQAPI